MGECSYMYEDLYLYSVFLKKIKSDFQGANLYLQNSSTIQNKCQCYVKTTCRYFTGNFKIDIRINEFT
jgi:hypothetical protein